MIVASVSVGIMGIYQTAEYYTLYVHIVQASAQHSGLQLNETDQTTAELEPNQAKL